MKKKTLPLALVLVILIATIPALPPSVAEAAYTTAPTMFKKLLILDFDPIMPVNNGVRFTEYYGWENKTTRQIVEDITARLKTASHGIINYEIKYEVLDEFPMFNDGYQVDAKTFLTIWDKSKGYNGGNMELYEPENIRDDCGFNYQHYIDALNLVKRRNNGEFDEIWMFIGRFAQGFETAMVGRGAYWINGAAFEEDCAPFRINWINKSRDDTPLHNLSHSMESIMSNVYQSNDWAWSPDFKAKPEDEKNTWEKFTSIDLSYPGKAAVGYCHYTPNSESDYDYDNTRKVYSTWRDWRDNYPNLTGKTELVNVDAWYTGKNHDLDWQTFCFSCFPHVTGRDEKGYSHNWWEYYQNLVYTVSLDVQLDGKPVDGS